ncbi:hypothetical protein OUZ56_017145 [Daphnia magna]|uniref:Uncharacterized protein n=1 Tax=Daphnia magna TaxID=35525 RepID=A0ABR0AS81_9CRUS|nr:hypothetical protein OUZ56_017145 [Daphnia magna]
MAENPCPSVSSVKEKLKISREREEECAANLNLRRQDLLRTRTAAIDVVLAHQKAIVQLDQELEENSKDIKNVHVHFMSERETILNSFVGSLLKEKKKAAEVQPNTPQFVAPRHTPTIVCFLRTHLNQPGMVSCGRKIRECDGFMLLTNRERMELLFAQHRCFGCFLPLSVAGHLKLAIVPTRASVPGGPAVTYSAALTGRIVGGKGLRVDVGIHESEDGPTMSCWHDVAADQVFWRSFAAMGTFCSLQPAPNFLSKLTIYD